MFLALQTKRFACFPQSQPHAWPGPAQRPCAHWRRRGLHAVHGVTGPLGITSTLSISCLCITVLVVSDTVLQTKSKEFCRFPLPTQLVVMLIMKTSQRASELDSFSMAVSNSMTNTFV